MLKTSPLIFLIALIAICIFSTQALAAPVRADLAPRSVSIKTAKTPTSKSVLPAKIVISNKGQKTSPASSVVVALSKDGRLGRGDMVMSRTKLLPIAKSKTRTVVAKNIIPHVTKISAYRVIICVDVPSKIRETNEKNNCQLLEEKLTVYPKSMNNADTQAMVNVMNTYATAQDPAQLCAQFTLRYQAEWVQILSEMEETTFTGCTEAFSTMLAKYGPNPDGPKPINVAASYIQTNGNTGTIIVTKDLMISQVFGGSYSNESVVATSTLQKQADGTWLVDVEDEITSSGGGF